jgi:geranylgeranyl pyrophosphate synthase
LARVEARLEEIGPAADSTGVSQGARRHLDAGGRRFRARLALDAGYRLGLTPGQRVAIASSCELLHNASLIHDDSQDGDRDRRGRPAVWVDHGSAVAICVGDLFLSAAYAALAPLGRDAGAMLEHTHTRVASVISGQAADIEAQPGNADCAGYAAIAGAKSGGLLALPLELALLAADQRGTLTSAYEAARALAIGYQIADDIADCERDRSDDRLNMVAVATATGASEPTAAAAEHGHRHLERALAAAERLPAGSGALLQHEARRLRAMMAQHAPKVSV